MSMQCTSYIPSWCMRDRSVWEWGKNRIHFHNRRPPLLPPWKRRKKRTILFYTPDPPFPPFSLFCVVLWDCGGSQIMRWERRKRRKVLLRPYSSFPPSLLIFLQIRLWEIRVVKKFGKKGETELLFFPFSKEMEREKTTFLRGPQKGKYKKARKWRHSLERREGQIYFVFLPPPRLY